MVIGVGVGWSTSLAVLAAFGGRDLRFVRTPKFGIGQRGGDWRGMVYARGRPWGGLIELGLGLYCAWTLCLVAARGRYSVLPFMALYTAGFLTVGVLTIAHAMPTARRLLLLLAALAAAAAPAGAGDIEETGRRALVADGPAQAIITGTVRSKEPLPGSRAREGRDPQQRVGSRRPR